MANFEYISCENYNYSTVNVDIEESFDSLIYDIVNKILEEDLPQEFKAIHCDSYVANNVFRFQGLFTQGGLAVPAPLSILRYAKRYQILGSDKTYFSYTIWLDENKIINLMSK